MWSDDLWRFACGDVYIWSFMFWECSARGWVLNCGIPGAVGWPDALLFNSLHSSRAAGGCWGQTTQSPSITSKFTLLDIFWDSLANLIFIFFFCGSFCFWGLHGTEALLLGLILLVFFWRRRTLLCGLGPRLTLGLGWETLLCGRVVADSLQGRQCQVQDRSSCSAEAEWCIGHRAAKHEKLGKVKAAESAQCAQC